MNKLDIYKNQDYILNDAFDQAVVNIHIQKEQNGYKTYTVCGCEPGYRSKKMIPSSIRQERNQKRRLRWI